jgi:hypothetical protein
MGTGVSGAQPRGASKPVPVPSRDTFTALLEEFHLAGGKPLKVPMFCHAELDLHSVFGEVQGRGGYGPVTGAKRWKDVCRALGHDLAGQTSASFTMRGIYERCLLGFELHLAGEEEVEEGEKQVEVEEEEGDGEGEEEEEEEDAACVVCEGTHAADLMLLCDGCDTGYHIFCLRPPLEAIPEDDWFCGAAACPGVKPGSDSGLDPGPAPPGDGGAAPRAPQRCVACGDQAHRQDSPLSPSHATFVSLAGMSASAGTGVGPDPGPGPGPPGGGAVPLQAEPAQDGSMM